MSDPEKRKRYDSGVDLEGMDFEGFDAGGFDPNVIFRTFFGGEGNNYEIHL